jgi:hypothetical protein
MNLLCAEPEREQLGLSASMRNQLLYGGAKGPSPEERQDLERWAQSRTLPAGDVFRARLILALGEGESYREIQRNLQTSAATIARWRMRLEQDRLAGLEGRHKGSRPRTATAAVQARVVRRVQQKPNDGCLSCLENLAQREIVGCRRAGR